MNVVVFSFNDHEAANSAAAQLFIRLSLPVEDVSLGTHARMGSIHDGLPLLAAFVGPDSVDVAVAIVEGAGGTCVEIGQRRPMDALRVTKTRLED